MFKYCSCTCKQGGICRFCRKLEMKAANATGTILGPSLLTLAPLASCHHLSKYCLSFIHSLNAFCTRRGFLATSQVIVDQKWTIRISNADCMNDIFNHSFKDFSTRLVPLISCGPLAIDGQTYCCSVLSSLALAYQLISILRMPKVSLHTLLAAAASASRA